MLPIIRPSIAMDKDTCQIRRGLLLQNPENFTFPSNQHGHRLQDTIVPTLAARNESQTISANLISQEKWLVLLVIFLMFTTCCCFGTAYYLFTTSRCAFVSPPIGVTPGLVADQHLTVESILPLAFPCLIHIFQPFPRKFVSPCAIRHHGYILQVLWFELKKGF